MATAKRSSVRAINGIGVSIEYVPETQSTFVFPFDRTFFTKDEQNTITHVFKKEGNNVFHVCDLYIEYETVDI